MIDTNYLFGEIEEESEVRCLNKTDSSFDRIINSEILTQKKIVRNCPNVLIDASLIIEVLLNRNSIFIEDASNIMELVISNKLNGYITESGLKDIWDLARKLKCDTDANYLIIKLLNSFTLCKTDGEMILNVQKYHLNSFETGIQVECARKYLLDAIITLRYNDFLECGFKNFFQPNEFLKSYNYSSKKLLTKDSIKSQVNHCLAMESCKYDEEEKLVLFNGWKIEHFDITCSNSSLTSATVVVNNDVHNHLRHSESAFGIGATATLFTAFDKVIRLIVNQPNYILESIKVTNIEKGVEGAVIANIVINTEKKKIRKAYIHRNIIKACFYAYIEGIKTIYNYDRENEYFNQDTELMPISKISESEILERYNLGEREFPNINLERSNFVGVNFSTIDLRCSSLSFSNLERIDLTNANLTEAFLKKSIVSYANLSHTILCKAKLNDSIFRNSKLISSELIKADLTSANLTGADLSNADLTSANLTNANLSNANLFSANLTNVSLSNVDLTSSNLTNANLSNADLTGVNLTTTTIDGVNFSEANLSHADLRGLDLNKSFFCKPILTDTAMPEFKMEVYGHRRIARMIQLFDQFESNHYEIYAIHSNAFGVWWTNDIGSKFRLANKKLCDKGIPIKRVFIVPENNFDCEMNKIIEEQVNYGTEVRYLSETLAEDFKDFNLKTTNLLVCKNLSVEDNSFTTMMLFENEKEKSGYISFTKDDIQRNELHFNMIWNKAETYFQNHDEN